MFRKIIDKVFAKLGYVRNRKLSAKFSLESEEDLKNLHNIGCESELVNAISEEIKGDQTILMSRDNPYGWKLEELLEKVRNELIEKNRLLEGDTCKVSDRIVRNNDFIISNLKECVIIQKETMEVLDTLGENQGPLGKPRVGNRNEK